jgi:hypothetical protein
LVVKLSSIHVIIILTNQFDYKVHHLNVKTKTKFLHGVLEENIYIYLNMREELKKEKIHKKCAHALKSFIQLK